jgi:hypothetical protein
MSAELQQVWLVEKPILFVGTLKDIVKNKNETFEVFVEYDSLDSEYGFMSNEISLNATCSSQQTAPLLQLAKVSSRLGMFADVAIIGRVSEVSSRQARDSEGGEVSQLIGVADCRAAFVLSAGLSRDWITRLGADGQ